MADSAVSSTSGVSRPATTKRRARAASTETDNRPARAALAVEDAAQASPSAAEGHGAAVVETAIDLFATDDTPAAAHTMNLDPRQGTLDGFELPADALASLREREQMLVESRSGRQQPSDGREHRNRSLADIESDIEKAASRSASVEESKAVAVAEADEPTSGATGAGSAAATARAPKEPTRRRLPEGGNRAVIDEPAGNSPGAASPREPAVVRKSTEAAARVANAAEESDAAALATRAYDALAQSVAALEAALVDVRRAANENRRRMTRLAVAALAALLLVLVLGVVQTVVAIRAADASAAAEQKTGALLRAQQSELAAFIDAASGAAADIRDAADSLDAKLAAQPARSSAGAPPAVKHAPRSTHARKSAERTRG